jgi:hypothetical protein
MGLHPAVSAQQPLDSPHGHVDTGPPSREVVQCYSGILGDVFAGGIIHYSNSDIPTPSEAVTRLAWVLRNNPEFTSPSEAKFLSKPRYLSSSR